MVRLRSRRIMANHRPFAGGQQGASLYVGWGNPDPGPDCIQFRRLRLLTGRWTKGSHFNFGKGLVKISAVAQDVDPTTGFAYTLPIDGQPKTIYLQVRTFAADVECEHNFAPVRIVLDASNNDVTGILGTALLLGTEKRDGGVVRIRFVWLPAPDGQQPDTFTAKRTAGPSSPADVAAPVTTDRIQEIDTPALLDSAPYTYKITASIGATSLDVLTGIPVQADATGPPAPTSGTALPW